MTATPANHPQPGGPRSEDASVSAQPYYVRETQDWAIEQERLRHNQALFTVGEYALFMLMWHQRDHDAGLVARCTRCYGTSGVKAKVAKAYGQPEQHRCPSCFGTSFEGGFKARIIRPSIFSDADEDEQKQARGVVKPQALSVESTTDFRVRSGDYVFRANGDRYQLRVPQRVTLRTGFTMPTQADAAIGYNHARANQEDPTSVAFLIPPSAAQLAEMLTQVARAPQTFAQHEIVRAPLIPRDDP